MSCLQSLQFGYNIYSLRSLAKLSTLHILVYIVSLNIFVDELKHIIGSETTRRGLLCVFELFQHPVLNRRLLYVLLEGVLETLFPQHNLSQIFRKLHSRSGRVRDDFKTSQRTRSDLRRWAPFVSLFYFHLGLFQQCNILLSSHNFISIKSFCTTTSLQYSLNLM